MNDVLVDTDVLSFSIKGDSRAALYLTDLREQNHHLALMSVAELKLWAIRSNWGAGRIRSLEHTIDRHTIISPDLRTADIWAEISASRTQRGKPIGPADCWIAATALQYGLPLITHNAQDYVAIPDLVIVSHSR